MKKGPAAPLLLAVRHGLDMGEVSLHVRVLPVEGIPAHRMSDGRHMHPDLVGSSGLDVKPDEGASLPLLQNLIVRDRPHSVRTGPHHHQDSGHLLHIPVDDAAFFVLPEYAFADREVGADECPFPALSLEPCGGSPASCKDEDAGGLLVQPSDNPESRGIRLPRVFLTVFFRGGVSPPFRFCRTVLRAPRPAGSGFSGFRGIILPAFLLQIPGQVVCDRVHVMAGAGMHDLPRRFVHRNQVLVLIENPDASRGCGKLPCILLLRKTDADGLSRENPLGHMHEPPVTGDSVLQKLRRADLMPGHAHAVLQD